MSRILLVDDDDLVQIAICDVLETAGHSVVVARDGNGALDELKKCEPEILVTDIIMPDKDGIELIVAVKKYFPDVKIIAISGGGRVNKTELLNVAEELGADHCLRKPISPNQLLWTINQV